MNFSHPAFAPYRDLLAALGGDISLDALNALASKSKAHCGYIPLRFEAPSGPLSAAEYEMGIAASGIVPTREQNSHDFLNALVWLRFPRLKTAINLRHCQALAKQPGERQKRSSLRDQLTLLDESGLLAASARDDLLELLRGKCWDELFWDKRQEVLRHMQFIVIGHGLLEKCLAPFPAMTAKCLFLHAREAVPAMLDEIAAVTVRGTANFVLPPLPVQGIPGWDDNENRSYYLNRKIFRPPRTPSPAA